MTRHRQTARRAAALIATACLCGLGAAPVAAADPAAEPNSTPDERFGAAVTALGIPTTPDTDVPALGHQICDLLTTNLAGAVNPVPVVRGVVSTLQSKGLTRAKAGGLLKAAVVSYCPEHAPYLGR